MPSDYSGQNLRGRNFRGQNLEFGNFSGADIRSADFSGAILVGANFSGAKAGLQKRWSTLLVIVSWLLSGLSGLLFGFTSLLVAGLVFRLNVDNQIAGLIAITNEKIQGNYVQGNYYAGGEKQSLSDTAAEIQKLLEQLDKSYPSNTTTGKMAIATQAIEYIDSNQNLAQRVLSALKAGGTEALAQLLNHPAASFVIGALDDWQKTKGI